MDEAFRHSKSLTFVSMVTRVAAIVPITWAIWFPARSLCIPRKGSGVVLSVCTQGDLFQQASRASGISDSAGCVGGVVREPRQMIQLVFGFPCLFPNSHADIPILRGPRGSHDFSVVAMPHNEGIVDGCTVWRTGFIALGGEGHVPHSYDPIVGCAG